MRIARDAPFETRCRGEATFRELNCLADGAMARLARIGRVRREPSADRFSDQLLVMRLLAKAHQRYLSKSE